MSKLGIARIVLAAVWVFLALGWSPVWVIAVTFVNLALQIWVGINER